MGGGAGGERRGGRRHLRNRRGAPRQRAGGRSPRAASAGAQRRAPSPAAAEARGGGRAPPPALPGEREGSAVRRGAAGLGSALAALPLPGRAAPAGCAWAAGNVQSPSPGGSAAGWEQLHKTREPCSRGTYLPASHAHG